MNKKLKLLISLVILIAIGLIGYEVGVNRNVMLTVRENRVNMPKPIQTNQKSGSFYGYNNETQFPILDVPQKYLATDSGHISMGAGMGYNTVWDDSIAYQSYPTTTILLNPGTYSTSPTTFKPLGPQPEAPSDRIELYSEKQFDVDKDGKQERFLYFNLMGANVGESWVEIIKDNKVIFDASGNDYTKIIPAKDGNGFFLEWNDNYKMSDGYMRTRFVYDGKKFIPVYEQQIRYVRIKQ